MNTTVPKLHRSSLPNTGTCGNASLNNQTLPTTGTYTVLVNPGANSGGATFTLTQNITQALAHNTPLSVKIGRASCREGVSVTGDAGALESGAEADARSQ